MTFLDLFAGIGGFRLGLELAGHECIGYCEIDKFARRSYYAMHQVKETEWSATDVTNIKANEIPKANCWSFGFPCQDLSVAGKRKGIDGKRSSLFFTITGLLAQLEEKNRPDYLLIENVRNLLSAGKGFDFARLLVTLAEVGYNAEWCVINSSSYVPQNRERVYIVGHHRERCTRKVFPLPGENGVDSTGNCKIRQIGHIIKGKIKNPQAGRVYDPQGISPCLSTCSGGNLQPYIPILTPDRIVKRQNGRRVKTPGEPMFTLTAADRHGIVFPRRHFIDLNPDAVITRNARCLTARYHKGVTNRKGEGSGVAYLFYRPADIRIRRLTPLECFRLQGVPDEYFFRAQKVNSDTQLYKQAGNMVTVPVVHTLGTRMKV